MWRCIIGPMANSKNSVNNCLSIPDDDIPLSVAMLAKGYFGDDYIGG